MGDKPEDEARRLILARRKRFIAAAIAAVSVSAVEACSDPEPCLSPPSPDAGNRGGLGRGDASLDDASLDDEDAGDGAVPQPCLAPQPPDAGDPDANAPPQPCLAPPLKDGG